MIAANCNLFCCIISNGKLFLDVKYIMNENALLALIIAVVILLVLWHSRDMKKYALRPGFDFTGGATGKEKLPAGVTYLGEARSAAECQRLAAAYDAYTLKGTACYGIKFGKEDSGSISGLRPIYGGKLGTYYSAIDRKLATRPGGETMFNPADDIEFAVKNQSQALARAPYRNEGMAGLPNKGLSRLLNDDTYPIYLNHAL